MSDLLKQNALLEGKVEMLSMEAEAAIKERAQCQSELGAVKSQLKVCVVICTYFVCSGLSVKKIFDLWLCCSSIQFHIYCYSSYIHGLYNVAWHQSFSMND